jgi:ABC-type protease/lipase transport system fused ATPase/permease subunit
MNVTSTVGRLADGMIALFALVALGMWLRFVFVVHNPAGMAHALGATLLMGIAVVLTSETRRVVGWL